MDDNRPLSDDDLLDMLRSRMRHSNETLRLIKQLNDELSATNRKLADSESMKSHFLSNVTNEMVNPFSSILLLSKSIMQINTCDLAKVKNMATMIYNEAFNLNVQLRNIFAATKVEAGVAGVEISNVDVAGLVKGIIKEYGHKIQAKYLDVNFQYAFSDDLSQNFTFPTDAEKLGLIVANILGNSIKFSKGSGRIDIKAGVFDHELVLSIRDRGAGIRPDMLDRIFDRFEQGDREINSVNEGHGLGLSVTKAYLDILEGRIEISSEPGEGTLIIIGIPEREGQAGAYAFGGADFLFDTDQDAQF